MSSHPHTETTTDIKNNQQIKLYNAIQSIMKEEPSVQNLAIYDIVKESSFITHLSSYFCEKCWADSAKKDNNGCALSREEIFIVG